MASLGLVFAVPLLLFAFILGSASAFPLWPAGLALMAVAIATVTNWARYYANGDAGLVNRPAWQQPLAVGAIALFGVFGAIHLAGEIEAILSAASAPRH